MAAPLIAAKNRFGKVFQGVKEIQKIVVFSCEVAVGPVLLEATDVDAGAKGPTRTRENDGAHFFFLEDRNQGGELETHGLIDCVQYVGPVSE